MPYLSRLYPLGSELVCSLNRKVFVIYCLQILRRVPSERIKANMVSWQQDHLGTKRLCSFKQVILRSLHRGLVNSFARSLLVLKF